MINWVYVYIFFAFLTLVITCKLGGVSELGVQSCMLIIQVLSVLFPMGFMVSMYGILQRFYTCLKQNSKDSFSCHLDLLLSMCPCVFSRPCVFMRWEAVKYSLFSPTVENSNQNLDSLFFPQLLSMGLLFTLEKSPFLASVCMVLDVSTSDGCQ